jgi:predicted transport protein
VAVVEAADCSVSKPGSEDDSKSVADCPDVSKIGHFGTGDSEVTIHSAADFETAKPLIEKAYRRVGG